MAGGFMAGFGSAFSKSFESARQNAREKENDMFKLKYADYISRRDEINKEEKEDSMRIKAAKEIVEATGAPSEMWSDAHAKLASGWDLKDVKEFYETNDFTVRPMDNGAQDGSGAAKPEDSLAVEAGGAVNAQMKASGMATPEDTGQQGLFSGITNALDPRPNNAPQVSGREQRVNSRISEAAGVSQEELDRVLGPKQKLPGAPDVSFTAKPKWDGKPNAINSLDEWAQEVVDAKRSGDPERISRAEEGFKVAQAVDLGKITNTARQQAAANGTLADINTSVLLDENGEFSRIVHPEERDNMGKKELYDPYTDEVLDPARTKRVGKDFVKRYQELSDKLGPDVAAYQQKSAGLNDALRSVGEIRQLIDPAMGGDPAVLSVTADVVSTLQGVAREAYTASTLLTNEAKEKGVFTPAGFNQLREEESKLLNALGPEAQSLAGKRAVLEAKVNIAAYRFAMMEGMSGREVSNADFERFRGIIFTGNVSENDPKIIQQKLSSYVEGKISKLRTEGNALVKNNYLLNDFANQYGGIKPWKDIKGVDEELANISDPIARAGLEYIGQKEEAAKIKGDDDWSGIPTWVREKTQLTPSQFKNVDERTMQLLKKKLGVQ
jgi:hypothetical protein